MFEGNKECSLCKKEIDDKKRKFGGSLRGYTYVFCMPCYENKKDAIQKILQEG
ncbi:MAG TPA: hypothetical protein VJH24_02725 [Candidatus Bilamarchaeaceae archaeon]|nr:hypothetical protein [Candidatus Bilamarchaeaceae archaeon]